MGNLMGKDLLSVADLSRDEIRRLLSETIELKAKGWLSVLERKTLALVFEKPSLRTRVSFEVAMRQLGGQAIYLSPAEVGLGKRESVADVARVLSRYVDAIAARTFAHQTLEVMARYAHVPVINGLSDLEHPCQALADMVTVIEKKGELHGLTIAFIGDGNNVARSLLLAAVLTGMHFRIASPRGYEIEESLLQRARGEAAITGGSVFTTGDPCLAARGADVVYTDVWASMGQEAEAALRRTVFAGYQVNEEVMSVAAKDAIIMHPLPAHHGDEIAEGILDSPHSVVFDQAENRMHLQKALLLRLLAHEARPAGK